MTGSVEYVSMYEYEVSIYYEHLIIAEHVIISKVIQTLFDNTD